MLSQAIEAMDMVVMAMEEAMEVMVDIEAMVMARERLKLMLSQDTEAMDMVVMEEAMEVMVDTEAMVMARERLRLSQVTEAMDMVVMEEVMEVMVDTEAMDMESKYILYFNFYHMKH